MTEEFSLPFLLGSIYLFCKYFRNEETKQTKNHPVQYAFFYGFAVGFIAFIRITNAAAIGAMILTIAVYLLIHHEYQNLVQNIIFGFLGFSISFGLPCIYFTSKGLLMEMLNNVFLFGTQYASEVGLKEHFIILLNTQKNALALLLIPVVICICTLERKWYYWFFSFLSILALVIAVSVGNAYLHYFTLLIPHIVFGLVLIARCFNPVKLYRIKVIASYILTFIIVFHFQNNMSQNILSFTENNLQIIRNNNIDHATYNAVQDIRNKIRPEDSVYGFGNEFWSRWYTQASLFPAYKYMDWQAHYLQLKPEIEEAIVQWITQDGSSCIVTPNSPTVISDTIHEIINQLYTVDYKNDRYILYRRKDTISK